MAVVVSLGAKASREPKTLRSLGALMCMQGLSASLLGPQHAQTVLEWETMRPALLRAGAIVALACGVFMVFALTTGPASRGDFLSHPVLSEPDLRSRGDGCGGE